MEEDKLEVTAIVADTVVDIAFPLAMEEVDMDMEVDTEVDMVVDIFPVATDMEVLAGLSTAKVTKEQGFIAIGKREEPEKMELWKKFLKPSICW